MKLNYCPQCRVVYYDADECATCQPRPNDPQDLQHLPSDRGYGANGGKPRQKLQPCRLLTNSSEYGQQTLRCGKCGKKIMWLGGNVDGPLLVNGWTCACPDCGVETRVSEAKATTETRDAM